MGECKLFYIIIYESEFAWTGLALGIISLVILILAIYEMKRNVSETDPHLVKLTYVSIIISMLGNSHNIEVYLVIMIMQ